MNIFSAQFLFHFYYFLYALFSCRSNKSTVTPPTSRKTRYPRDIPHSPIILTDIVFIQNSVVTPLELLLLFVLCFLQLFKHHTDIRWRPLFFLYVCLVTFYCSIKFQLLIFLFYFLFHDTSENLFLIFLNRVFFHIHIFILFYRTFPLLFIVT